MIKNYIFDFGQVIVKFDTQYMTSKYIKQQIDIDTVKDVVFDRIYWDKLDEGTITDFEIKKSICERLPKDLQNEACMVYDYWYENLPFIDGMYELLKQIKANGGKLFLLSNISIGFAQNYHKVPKLKELFEMFDGLVFSGPLGIVKPDSDIFEYLFKKYRLDRLETVFIDDNINNINGAQRVGIKAVLFDGSVKNLKEKLKSL